MQRIKVAVIRGGDGVYFDVSIKTGAKILEELNTQKYQLVDVWVSPDGVWHERGMETMPFKIFEKIDFAINVLSGLDFFNTQKTLALFNVPFMGPSKTSALFSMNKKISRKIFYNLGVKTPRAMFISPSDDLNEKFKKIFQEFMQPVLISPTFSPEGANGHYSYGYRETKKSAESIFKSGFDVVVEEGIRGKKISCFTVDNFRGEGIYNFIESEEILKNENNGCKHIYPSSISKVLKKKIVEISKNIHRELNLKGYIRHNFIVSPVDEVYIISVDPMPFFDEEKGVDRALTEIGCPLSVFLDELISF